MSANSQHNSKKYGNKSLSINVPPPSGSFLASFYGIDEGFKQQENSMVQHLAAGIVALDGITKKQKTSDRTFAANRSPAMSLEKAIHLGHDDDIAYLMSQMEGTNNTLVVFNVHKLGFMIPSQWKDERQKRCGRWLVENLGFKESLIGDSFTYTHDKAKRIELYNFAKKEMDERERIAAATVPPPQFVDEPVLRSRPNSLNMTILRVSSTDSTSATVGGRNSGTKRSHQRSRDFRDNVMDSDSDENTADSFTPRSSGRTSRASQSPFFFNTTSGRSPRAATASPMDGGLTFGITSMRLGDSVPPVPEAEPRVTRSRNGSHGQISAMNVNVLTRSRNGSESTAGESLVSIATKSRNGSLDLGRCASRSGPVIKEESQEDLEQEDLEVAGFGLPSSTSAYSLITPEEEAAEPMPQTAGQRVAENFFNTQPPAAFAQSPLPMTRKKGARSVQITTVEGDDALDIASDASTMRDSDEENDDSDGDDPAPFSSPPSARPASAPQQHDRSHTPPTVLFAPAAGSMMGMAPHELSSHIGLRFEMGLAGEGKDGNSPLSTVSMRRGSGVGAMLASDIHGERVLPSGAFSRRNIPEPSRPVRLKGYELKRTHSAPVMQNSHHVESSPGATVSAVGMGGPCGGPFFRTPQAVRPVDTFHWEHSQAVSARVTQLMVANFRAATMKYGEEKAPQGIPLYRAKSEGNQPSPDDNLPWHSGLLSNRGSSFGLPFIGDRRESSGSVGPCPFQALTNDRFSNQHLLVGLCDDDMGMHGCSPTQAAQQLLRDRRPGSRPGSSNSLLGMYPSSPHAAFSVVSPRQPAQNMHVNMINHSPGSMLMDTSKNDLYRASLSSSFTPVFADSRASDSWKLKKKRQSSMAKSRRMSVAALPNAAPHTRLHAINEASFNETSYMASPAPRSKSIAGARASLLAQATATETSFVQENHSGCDSDFSLGHNTSNTSSGADNSFGPSGNHFFRPSSTLNELNFMVAVIGGVYQRSFDNAAPVVAVASAAESRVVDVNIDSSTNCLMLSLYQPKEKSTEHINLGEHWQWMRCSPTGYLVFNTAIVPKQHATCYFLPKHPDDWQNKSAPAAPTTILTRDGRVLRNRRVSIVPAREFNPRVSQSFSGRLPGMEMDAQALRLTLPSDHEDLREDVLNRSSTTEMSSETEQSEDESELNLSVSVMESGDVDMLDLKALGLDAAPAKTTKGSAHWSNADCLALILDFLIDDSCLFGAASAAPVASAPARSSQRRAVRSNSGTSVDNASEIAMMQLQACQSVSKTWALAAYMVIAQRKSSLSMGAKLSFNYLRFKAFATKFQEGMYLSEGVCKNVYCVVNPSTANLEAVSVMDIMDLKSRSMDVAITQELKISLLCSALVNLKICPNLVQVYSLFQADYDAPTKLWGAKRSFDALRSASAARRSNTVDLKKNDVIPGSYQYIRMEFCSGGDVEDRVRAVGLPDLASVRSMFFQMCFSLYACREKLCMRHFDVKLLNFFVTTSDILHYSPSNAKQGTANVNQTTHLQIGLGQHIYDLPLPANALGLVKLADFGTSAVGSKGLGNFINLQQFTTLENTPPEFLLLGSFARQSYAADTFPLGLCLLHLLTGYAPYEELLKDVHCPDYLVARLRRHWRTEDTSSPYYLIHEVVKTLDMSDFEETNEMGNVEKIEPDSVLLDTLYRYMVLFGLSEEFSAESAPSSVYADSPVWTELFNALDLKRLHSRAADNDLNKPFTKLGAGGSKKHNAASAYNNGGNGGGPEDECAMQFQRDVQLWSVHIGDHRTMMQFRNRLAGLGEGAIELLESLVHFDPARRCTMVDALQHPVFASLRLNPAQAAATLFAASTSSASQNTSLHNNDSTVRYLHYYRGDLPVCTPTNGRSHLPSFSLNHSSNPFCDALPIL